jgi:hypothetical protein
MARFNICLVKPDNYIHSYAFLELGELLYFSLQELGHEVSFGFNNMEPSAVNILIGCHLLDPSFITQIPASTIILNTEQVYGETDWNKPIFAWAKHFQIWDYSPKNITKFNQLGINRTKLFKIGFQKELARLDLSAPKEIDVLFYGSVNERRKVIKFLGRRNRLIIFRFVFFRILGCRVKISSRLYSFTSWSGFEYVHNCTNNDDYPKDSHNY